MMDFKEKWRLILSPPDDGFSNMAIDYSILKSVSKNLIPTLRIYSWEKPTVTIGYFQSVKDEVNLDYLKKNNIDLIRRITGGGAVFHDQEITYSFAIPISHKFMKCSVEESFKKIALPVIDALKEIGLVATFSGLNDISINEKKISGNAQTRKEKIVLQHGTILLSINKKLFANSLKFSKVKYKNRKIDTALDQLTSVFDEIKNNNDFKFSTDLLIEKIIKNFERKFFISFEQSKITEKEFLLVNKIKLEIFQNKEWNYKK